MPGAKRCTLGDAKENSSGSRNLIFAMSYATDSAVRSRSTGGNEKGPPRLERSSQWQAPYGSMGASEAPVRTQELDASFMYAAGHASAMAMRSSLAQTPGSLMHVMA
jgi:hypothetical protein